MTIVPNEKQSFESLGDFITAADGIVFNSYPLNIDIDSMIYFFLVLSEGLRLPVIIDKLRILLSFFIQSLFGIIDEHILEQVFPDLRSDA